MAGKVFLVGAGPGDYRLLTLKACDCLKRADTVVYDRLADKRILQYAPQNAEFIYVGKASSQHTMTQDKICQLLVDLGKAGKTVVRLKGGDPFVFGRGGEEALLLQKNNIPFEIVPGVTSAISVPAYAGIPVTHRGVAASFSVITGHEDPTKDSSDINWEKLATATDTLVFLMGVANLPKITAKLIENGRPATTPVAIIRWGTKLQQQVWTSTLVEAAAMAQREGIKPPCIFLVGDVVNLRADLAWFDNIAMKPLFGKKVLVTRSRSQASKLTTALEELGAECIEAPAIKIVPPVDNYEALDKAIGQLDKYNWLIFTSTNGVEHFWHRLVAGGKDARVLYKARICAIGAATAQALASHGITADVVPERYQAEGIIEALDNELIAGTKILIPRAAEARALLPEALTKAGAQVDVVVAYETVMGDAEAVEIRNSLAKGEIDVVTFTSSSTVENLLKILKEPELLKEAQLAAIGPITAETMQKNGLTADIVAAEYTIEGLVQSIKEAF
ncbi:uroporphyrinogen-III C-methyltransferase [uncultured Anaerovibrio sp.]|uniref:uroporphyrinogen-III C-methyltransferase n=1 Tax=uncultured Anaerovibrio sp. TaxID=361586 RepID=UPI0025E86B89|nr:uroporphyrinogen-III C-methyltransferase [uncultured Anaerovibrio sp.]